MQKRYVNISLLKLVLCFEVICAHFWNNEPKNVFCNTVYYLVTCVVSLFLVTSFVLCGKMFENITLENVKKRFFRLCLPQVLWTVVYFVVYWLMDFFFGKNKISGFSDFWWQLFTGSRKGINQSMWYQIALIVITALFFIIFAVFKDKSYYIITVISIIIMVLQYCGKLEFFYDWKYELASSYGRVAEYFPIATLGMLIYKSNILGKIKKHPVLSPTILFALSVFVAKVDILPINPNSNYQGMRLVFSALTIFLFAYSLPLDRIPDRIQSVINDVSSCSLGVYCIHRLIETVLRGIFEVVGITFDSSSLSACFIIYIICFTICFIGVKLFGKNKYIRMMFV